MNARAIEGACCAGFTAEAAQYPAALAAKPEGRLLIARGFTPVAIVVAAPSKGAHKRAPLELLSSDDQGSTVDDQADVSPLSKPSMKITDGKLSENSDRPSR